MSSSEFIVDGDVTRIVARGTVAGEILIDTADLDKVKAVSSAWYTAKGGQGGVYAIAKVGGKTVRLHRVITDCPQGHHVDHINGNGLDDRKRNLRTVSPSINALNRASPRVGGFRGVRKLRRGFAGIVKSGKKTNYLGGHGDALSAALAVHSFLKSIDVISADNYARVHGLDGMSDQHALTGGREKR